MNFIENSPRIYIYLPNIIILLGFTRLPVPTGDKGLYFGVKSTPRLFGIRNYMIQSKRWVT